MTVRLVDSDRSKLVRADSVEERQFECNLYESTIM